MPQSENNNGHVQRQRSNPTRHSENDYQNNNRKEERECFQFSNITPNFNDMFYWIGI